MIMIKDFGIRLTLLLLLVGNHSFSQPSTVLPRDESAKDTSLASMVMNLKRIVNTKDFNALLTHIHPEIQIGFDGSNGKKAFTEEWGGKTNQTKLWPVLKRIMDMGGVFIKEDPKNMFVFPYAYQVELGEVEDAYNLFMVTGKNVNVREEPSLTAKVIGKLSYNVVTRDFSIPEKDNSEWLLITTLDKKIKGHVHRDFLYSPSDHRLFLKKEKNTWLVYMFLAGD